MTTLREKIESAAEIFDFDSRAETDAAAVIEFIETNSATIEESDWKNADANWPQSDREARTVVVLTPTDDGHLQPLKEWVIVIG